VSLPTAAEAVPDVAGVCATAGNTCAGGVADINVATIVDCNAVLDFEAAGFPTVNVNGPNGALIAADTGNGCDMTLLVGDLTVKSGGKIEMDKDTSFNPGRIEVFASGTITVEAGGLIFNKGGSGPDPDLLPLEVGPSINLTASGKITIDGTLFAQGKTALGHGGQINLISIDSMVVVGPTGLIETDSTDPGNAKIQIEACAGVEVAGKVLAFAKKRGTVLEIFSREFIDIKAGAVLSADLSIGDLGPADQHRLSLEARGPITIAGLLTATAGKTNKKGGLIEALSTEDTITCTASAQLLANAPGSGSDGGEISLRAFEDLDFDCVMRAQGNKTSGDGGKVLLKSFNGDVIATPGADVQTVSQTPGTITVESCSAPNLAAAAFNPAPVVTSPLCGAAPTEGHKFGPGKPYPGPIPPCTAGCFCLERFSIAGGVLTIRGQGLKGVQLVEFNATCQPDPGAGIEVAKAAFLSQTDTQIKLTLPGGASGTHIILSDPASGPSSACSKDTIP
jgi:hypothetical protein